MKEKIIEIKQKISTLKELDINFKIFGSENHKYLFNPVLSLEEISSIETENNIKLREDYKLILTELGNGGAGCGYGLEPFNTDRYYSVCFSAIFDLGCACYIWLSVEGILYNVVEGDFRKEDTNLLDLYLEWLNKSLAIIDPNYVINYIQKAKENKETSLDLKSYGLESFPKELLSYSELKVLHVEKNSLDLSGISMLTNLEQLYLSYNYLNNIEELKYLNKLVVLDLGNNQIEDISSLSDLYSLKHLKINNNNIQEASCLSSLKLLESLNLDRNYITDCNFLSDMNIKKISFRANCIKDISNLSLPKIEVLSFKANEIKKIDSLNFPLIVNLDLSMNKITKIDSLNTLTNLEILNLSLNKIKDISALFNLKNLISLSFIDNKITDISVVSNFKELKRLGLRENKITDILPIQHLIDKGYPLLEYTLGNECEILIDLPINK